MARAKGDRIAARRDERRKAQFAALQQRAATAPAPSARHEHIEGLDIHGQEEKYEPFLLAIESGLVAIYDERNQLPVDDEAERALRLVIARFEGDSGRRSGSPDVDALADGVARNIDLFFRRHPLLSRAEIVGCLRRVISSIRTWHSSGNPRAYFDYVGEMIHELDRQAQPASRTDRTRSGLWIPGQDQPAAEEDDAPRRPGGLWLPGD